MRKIVRKVIKFSDRLKSYGVPALWHMTRLDNLESILRKGIFCRNLMRDQVSYQDISNPDVQMRRI